MAYLVKQSHRAAAVTAPVPVDETLPRACVIGAGSSGIAAAKHLHGLMRRFRQTLDMRLHASADIEQEKN